MRLPALLILLPRTEKLSRKQEGMTEADSSLMLAILRELRAEAQQHRTMLLQLGDATRRHDRRFEEIDRRFSELKSRIFDIRGEIELMLKAELPGRLTHFEA
jgi:hypothetical protein